MANSKHVALAPWKRHVICWLVFITYEVLVSYTYVQTLSNPIDYIGHYSLNIGLFYFNYLYVLRPSSARPLKRYLVRFSLVIIELVAYMGLKYEMYLLFFHFHIYTKAFPKASIFVIESIWRSIYFIGLSVAYWFAMSAVTKSRTIAHLERMRLTNILEKEAIEKDLLQAENIRLKAQINPHFLFNSLSFIHNNVRKHSEAAGETIILLAEIMRYAIQEPHEDQQVFLNSEIDHINNYISLNQYRFDHQLCIEFNCEGNNGRKKIVPLLLITIIENVFKYGNLFNPDNPACISLSVRGSRLEFKVHNQKSTKKAYSGHGIGMSNVKKRLQQHYPERHQLIVEETNQQYNLLLNIDLND